MSNAVTGNSLEATLATFYILLSVSKNERMIANTLLLSNTAVIFNIDLKKRKGFKKKILKTERIIHNF